MIYIFDWLGDFIGGIGSAIGEVFDFLGEQISNAIWNTMIQWLYETIYNAVADFFTMMGNMGADVFDLTWVQATINLFTLFGWALFVAGTVVAVFDVAIEYQNAFNQWMKQIAALCLTAFMQTTLLFLGLLTFPGSMLLGLGIMLASNEVPRIAQQFGLDSSVKVNMTSIVHATTTAVNLTRSVARAAK